MTFEGTLKGTDRLRCAHCEDVIGVYEPLCVILSDGGVVDGSWLTRGRELEREGGVAFHERCYHLQAEGLGPHPEA